MLYNFKKSDELYHYGIKGQKWGIRRFQYEDGSLTPEGKRRYYDRIESTIKNIKDSESKFQNTQNRLKQSLKKYKRKKVVKRIDVSKLDDAELRQYITRKNLERQYIDLQADELKTGFDTVMTVLDYAGDAVMVGLAINQLFNFIKKSK